MSATELSREPEGATHRHAGYYYRKVGPTWLLFGSACQWVATACEWDFLDKNAEPLIPAWSGEGPPPVGTVCEFHGAGAACPDDPWHPDLKDGDHVTIIAYFNDSVGQVAAFTFKARNENIASIQVEQARPGAFRPIRTPEQIAADKRLHEIRNALTTIKAGQQQFPNDLVRGNITLSVVEAMIDAGYRVQVMP